MRLLLFCIRRQPSLEKGSHRSGSFDGKRRQDRMHASIRGYYANRGCAAHEVPADEATAREDSTALTQRQQLQKCGCFFFASVASQVRNQAPKRVTGNPVYQTEAEASVWKGGATEHKRVSAAFTVTAITKPVRSATTPARRQHREAAAEMRLLLFLVFSEKMC